MHASAPSAANSPEPKSSPALATSLRVRVQVVAVTRLTAVPDELAARAAPQKPPLDFMGILSAWDSGAPGNRRDLLARIFDALNVEDVALSPAHRPSRRCHDPLEVYDECGGCGGRGIRLLTRHTGGAVRVKGV